MTTRGLFLLSTRTWLVVVLILLGGHRARAALANEYEVKALFLFHFAEFVTWPPGAFRDDRSPLVIGIVGEDPFGRSLDDAIAGEMAQGHPLVIARFPRAQDVGFCHILYVSPSADGEFDELRARLRQRPVLTVGDTGDFVRRGGIIRFLTSNSRTHLQINLSAARQANLIISSKLLQAADVVAPWKGHP